ncbi:hypothetical protein [Amycolatopsis sp. Hca4]|uniref:hypothetical protein n=1 Tax=Amycolatopsis sp. Hca4 TaxID=2742131 RepID=UPI00158FEB9B|nr:hypothetical protein [Amycolatopsis sp. Hca4]QKV73718.1 hypothetical protein HUT10_07985 [Amycolatopsis sp. Hca4]
MTSGVTQTQTTNVDKDGNVSGSVQSVTASPQTQAQTIAGTGGGILGAVLGAANFVYSIVKDHGAKLTMAVESGGDGISSGTADEAKFKADWVGEFSASGVWYTHTRAFGSLLNSHRGKLPHEKTKDTGDFSSAYICTVFPYQLRWNLYAVTPKPISKKDEAAVKQGFASRTADAYDKFYERVKELKLDDLTVQEPGSKGKKLTVKYRTKNSGESFTEYLKFLRKFQENEPRIKGAIGELEATVETIKAEAADYDAQLLKATQSAGETFYVMRNIALSPLSDLNGVKQHYWQHLSINSKFTITPRKEKPYGFTVGLVWGETALGYGYPGQVGSYEITQDGPAETDVELKPNGKLGRRFGQFLVVNKDR